jgi:TonB-linked SusC/RagA family outer membrane protein
MKTECRKPRSAVHRLAAPAARTIVVLSALLLALAAAGTAAAQGTGRITGTVTDSTAGRPLGSVAVTVAGTRLGATSDESGRYTILNVPAGTHTLEARRLGYRPTTRPLVNVTDGGTTTADFRMSAAPLSLEAVVTTGVVDPTAGTRVPFTVGRLDMENLPVPSTNAVESVQGKIAGVTVVPAGQPGSGTNILLRTPTSISKSNSPLVVVDGIIQSSAFGASSADLQGLDIESIEVIKGAAAASLYGSRAASGVIQIRTRRGSDLTEGPTRVSVRSEIGTNQLGHKINWAQHHFYRTNDQGEYVDATGAVVERVDRVARPVYERFQDVAYRDPVYDQVERFFSPGQFFKNSVNLAQNAARTNWFLSLVNSREDGVILESGEYNQNDLRLNLDHRWRDNLTVGFSGYHSRSLRNELYGSVFFDLINQAPDIDLWQPDPDGTPYLFQGDPEGREENPLYLLSTRDSKRWRARTQGNLETRFIPLDWLSLDANFSYDRSDRRNNFFLDQGIKTAGFPEGGPGEISNFTGTTDAVNASASANLIGRFSDLTLRSTFRTVIEREMNRTTDASGSILSTPGVRSLDNAQEAFVSSDEEEVRSSGYFVNVGADYAGKYIVDGLVRRDGSSLFGPEERWNTYYRVSGAYRMAEEEWWPFTTVSEFKLRASRGTAGGRPSFADQYETFGFSGGGGVVKQNLGNRFLKPEHATENEFGVDAILLDRYSLQLSYATSRVVDQLILIPLAGFYGYGNQWQNAGTVEGHSLEATIEASVMRTADIDWRLGFVADRSRHKVTEFDRSCFTTGTIAFRCAGETLGAMYGFSFLKSASQLPADAQASSDQFAVNDEGLLVWVGAGNSYTDGETSQLWGTTATIGTASYNWGLPIILRDSTGSSALVKIGDGNANYKVGLTNTFSWRNLQLYALVNAAVGGNAYNQTNQRMYQWGRSADVDQAGKRQELKKPVEYYVALYSANNPTDYFVEDAGFVKLREVSLRYRVPPSITGRMSALGVSGAALSLIGRNLLTFTDYKGYDPEVGGTLIRLDSFDYPSYRTFTGAIEVTF